MTSRREQILARLAVVVGDIAGVEFSARNYDRVSDSKLPAAIVYDGDEQPFENLRATGARPNVVIMTPAVVISLGEVPENVGTLSNDWLAKVQKAVLFDSEIERISGGHSAPNNRIPNGGARYMGCTT